MNEFPRFFRKLFKGLIILLLIFSPLLIFNIVIDPYGIFLNFNKYIPMEPNKRFIKMRYILRHPKKYHSFIFGSSRVNFINPDNIHDARYFNMTYSNGAPRDHYEDVQIMVRHGVKIKNLLIGVDFLSLLENTEPVENDLLRQGYPVSWGDKFNFYKSYILFRPDKDVIKIAFSKGEIDRSRLLENGTVKATLEDSGIEENIAEHVAARKFFIPFSTYKKHPDTDGALREIANLIRFSRENHINIRFFIQPTHCVTYLNMNLEAYFIALTKLASLTDFDDFSGLNSVAVNSYYFHEASHYRRKTGDLIIARMFGYPAAALPSDFGRRVTALNIRDQIAFHKTLLRNYFNSARLDSGYKAPVDLSTLKRTAGKPAIKVARINGIAFTGNSNQTILITTPWIKIESIATGPVPAGCKVYVKIGKCLFGTTEISKSKEDSVLDCNGQSGPGWSAWIPVNLLQPGEHFLKVALLGAGRSDYTLSEAITSLNIVQLKKIPPADSLEKLKPSAKMWVDYINGISSDTLTLLDKGTRYLNITGWAVDSLNNSASGGVIVTLDGVSYPSQFILSRADLIPYFKNPNFKHAGWGVTIPVEPVEGGTHELTFRVLNQPRTGYYISERIIRFK
ncbi:MAG: hypothetical protein ACOYNC_16525 [Bacteroidales bacterium]